MTKTKELALIFEVVDRAEKMNLVALDRLTLRMDLDFASMQFNIDFERLLEADDYNFSHDVVGIQNHINRHTGEVEGFFVPRFADMRGEE